MYRSKSKLFSITMTLCFLSSFFANPGMAQLPSPVLEMTVEQVSEHVHVVYGFPNIVYVVGDDATLVIDTGLGLEQGRKVLATAQALSRGDKLFLTTTHFHPEHVAGEGAFPQKTILIRADSQHAEMQESGQFMLDLFRGFGDFGPFLEGVNKIDQPDITFADDMHLDLGGVTVRLMSIGIGHTQGDELIYVEEDKVLISGDIIQNKVVPTVTGGNLTNWINLMTQLEQLGADIIVPTHSRVGDGNLIAESRAFMLDMRSRVLSLYKTGMTIETAQHQISEAFARDYPQWAANINWNNTGAIPGFVQTVYNEADNF